jgi:enediyne biosynthesis protein E4
VLAKITRRSFLQSAVAAIAVRNLFGRTLPHAVPPLLFEDVTAQSGVRFKHESSLTSQKYLPESMGSGVAMLDYDSDGWLDLFFVNGARIQDPMPRGASPDKSDPRFWNRLYRNNRDGTFTDVTQSAGLQGHSYGMGVATGDYDNDGNLDLLVTNLGGNILYHNNGDGTFTDVTVKAGLGGSGWCTGACFVDYDRDGRLDLIVSRYVEWDFSQNIYCGERKRGYRAYCHPDQFSAIAHLVFHNNGDGTFTDVSKQCGIARSAGKGLGIAVDDFDGDGWPDIFVANDSMPEQLFRNRRDGTFEEVALSSGLAYDEMGHVFAGMGADFGDYENRGWPSMFVNALANQKYKLFRNEKGKFEEVTDSIEIGALTMEHSGWGTKWIDFDNDGWLDLFVAQGHVMDNIESTEPRLRYREPPLLLKNERNRFRDMSAVGGPAFRNPIAARGAAFGDLDNDGLVDIAINCNNGPALILRNRSNSDNHWLSLNLIGSVSNRDAIGAKIRLVSDGTQQMRFVSTAGSYVSASDKRVHFGLGASKRAQSIEITWPSGTVQRLESIPADQILTVREPTR